VSQSARRYAYHITNLSFNITVTMDERNYSACNELRTGRVSDAGVANRHRVTVRPAMFHDRHRTVVRGSQTAGRQGNNISLASVINQHQKSVVSQSATRLRLSPAKRLDGSRAVFGMETAGGPGGVQTSYAEGSWEVGNCGKTFCPSTVSTHCQMAPRSITLTFC